jgi:hypothetical protein
MAKLLVGGQTVGSESWIARCGVVFGLVPMETGDAERLHNLSSARRAPISAALQSATVTIAHIRVTLHGLGYAIDLDTVNLVLA